MGGMHSMQVIVTPRLGLARLKQKIARLTRVDGECHVWTGNLNLGGYPRIRCQDGLHLVHRLVRSLADGTPYGGTQVHHKCHNRACIRLEHLEPVSATEHARIHHPPQEVCKRGHSMEDSYKRPDTGAQQCRTCIEIRSGWERERRRAERATRPPVEWRPCVVCGSLFRPSYRHRNRATACGQACRMRRFLLKHPTYKKHGRLPSVPRSGGDDESRNP